MSPEILILIVIGIFIALILMQLPVGIGIGLAGALGIVMLIGWPVAGNIVELTPYSSTAKNVLIVIPMYILLGMLISNSGIGADIYRAVNRGVRRLPGGLGAAAVVATTLFSGISGSSAADVATFGRISVNEMTRHGYDKAYAASIVAAAGAFAALVPPSVAIVIYAVIAEQNVSAMILAGVIPGVISGIILAGFIIVRAIFGDTTVGGKRDAVVGAKRDSAGAAAAIGDRAETYMAEKQAMARPAPSTAGGYGGIADSDRANPDRRKENRDNFLGILYTVIIFAIVIGGLYGGIFTATESGAVGAFAALIIAIFAGRSKRISFKKVAFSSLHETANVTSMIFLLLIGGAIFAFFVATSSVPHRVSTWASGLEVPPQVIVAIFLLMLLILGTFLDGLSTMLLTVPIVAPVVDHLGLSGIWFGVLVLKMIEIGLITPPVGINTFIISGIAKVPVWDVFRRIWVFVALDLVVTAMLFIFPDIVLWLPRLAGMVP